MMTFAVEGAEEPRIVLASSRSSRPGDAEARLSLLLAAAARSSRGSLHSDDDQQAAIAREQSLQSSDGVPFTARPRPTSPGPPSSKPPSVVPIIPQRLAHLLISSWVGDRSSGVGDYSGL